MQFRAWCHVHLQHAYFISLVFAVGVHELYGIPGLYASVHYLEVCDDTAEGVEDAVEDERLQGCVLIAFGVGDTLHHGAEDFGYALTCLAAGTKYLFALASDKFYDFVLHLIGHGIGHVALVDDGDDFQVLLDGHVEVADGLGLNTLRGVHYKQGTFACRYGTRNLVTEVHVSRSVDEVQYIASVFDIIADRQGTDTGIAPVVVFHLYGMALDGDATLLFQVHVVQHLPVCGLDGFGYFQKSVGQGALAVVDVCYDAKVAYSFH